MQFGQAQPLANITNGIAGIRVGRCEPIIISDNWDAYTYQNQSMGNPMQDTLTSEQLGLIKIANYRAAVAAGWEDRYVNLVASTHIMAVFLGALESEGEQVFCPDLDVSALSAGEVTFLND